jgi:hypothetical protein
VRPNASRASAYREFEIHSGRRVVATQYSSSARQAAIDYVRAFGSTPDEINVLGPDMVAWRGGAFRGRPRSHTAQLAGCTSPVARGLESFGTPRLHLRCDDLGTPEADGLY